MVDIIARLCLNPLTFNRLHGMLHKSRRGGFAEIDDYIRKKSNRGVPHVLLFITFITFLSTFLSHCTPNVEQVCHLECDWQRGEERGGGSFGGRSKSFMGRGEEEIADRTLSVSNYFYCPKSPFLVQSGLLGSCKKSSPSHSSPRDISRTLSCCGAKARCIQVNSIHLRCNQQRNLLHPHTYHWLSPNNYFPPKSP